MSGILLASNEEGTMKIMTKLLKTEGYDILSVSDLGEIEGVIDSNDPDMVVTVPSQTWDKNLELLTKLRSQRAGLPVVVIVDGRDDELVAKVNELNPFACIHKPLKVDKLLESVQKAVDYDADILCGNINLNLKLESKPMFSNVVSESPAMKSICEMINRVAATDVTVTITGEGGTGKHAVARALHENSKRKDAKLVIIDCSDERETLATELFGEKSNAGALEDASGGSLFLSCISGLSKALQSQLLTAFQEKSAKRIGSTNSFDIDIRLVVSARQPLDQLVENGFISEEFGRYLKVIPLNVPPLRDRVEDIMPCARLVLSKLLGDGSLLPAIHADVVTIFENYSWPGNVSEMKDKLCYAIKNLRNGSIVKESLPEGFCKL